MKQNEKVDVSAYRTYGFPLLGLMALVGTIGIVLAVVLNYFF